MKRILVLMVAVAFVLSVTGFCLAANDQEYIITKIIGNKVTVQDAKGKLQIITISGNKVWKVGDKVVVQDGKIFSWGSGGGGGVKPTPGVSQPATKY